MAKAKPPIGLRRPGKRAPEALEVNQKDVNLFVEEKVPDIERPDVQQSGSLEVQTPKIPDAQMSERSDSQTSKRPSPVKHREWRKMTLYLPPDLARRLQIHCVQQDLELSDAVASAVEGYLDSRT